MTSTTFDHSKEAFDFIEDLERLGTTEEVINKMESALTLFGFENFILTGIPNPQQRFEQMVLLRKWPAGWFEIYAGENYVRSDPVIRLCKQTVNPFEWSEAPYDRESEPKAHEIMTRATEFRMARGFCLPIHGLTGYEACISMSGIHLDLTPRTKPAIHLMALYAFDRVRQLVLPTQHKTNPLSAREREVLQWSAIGKTASEVAEIMEITERTVTFHLERAREKLSAQSKTHACVKALQNRLIDL